LIRFTVSTNKLYSSCCWTSNADVNTGGWTTLFRISINSPTDASRCCWCTSSRFFTTTK